MAICPVCGVGTTWPIVPESEFGQFYPTDYSPYHDPPTPTGALAGVKAKIQNYFERRPLRTLPLSEIPDTTGESLDVGCGSGDLGALLISEGWQVTGVEPSPQAAETAAAKGLDVKVGTLSSVELEGQRFSLVTFQHSLEHVYDPSVDLAAVRTTMLPGARLLITVPNFGSRQRRIFGSRWFHLDLPRHRYHYTPDGLRALASRTGFDVDRIETTSSFIGLAGSLSYVAFGRWRFDGGPWATRAISYLALLLLPIAWLLAQFGGGDYLHLVASKPQED